MQRYDHGGDVYAHSGPLLDFSANTNPLGYPPGVREALIGQIDSFQRYPDARCRALTGALARRHGIAPGQVLCGNGAADLIYRVCACLRPKQALVTAPAFSEYERAVIAYGGAVRQHRLLECDQFDVDGRMLAAVTPDTPLVFLCTPNNPTGRLAAPDLIRALAARCGALGGYLVLDECFIEFTDGPSMAPLLSACPHLLILRAFTKMYAMAGLRLGYLLAGDEALLARIAAFGATWSVSGPAQAAGMAALAAEGWAETTRAFVREERAYLRHALRRAGLTVFAGEANYLLVKSPHPLYRPLLDRGILVRDCGNYTGLGSRFIRVAVRTREQNLRLLAAVREAMHG